MEEIPLELVDAGTKAHMKANPRAAALLALLARIIAHVGLIHTIIADCPYCEGRQTLTIALEGNRVTCGACRRITNLRGLMDDPGAQEQLHRLMRARPRSR